MISGPPTFAELSENPLLLNEMEPDDLFSLEAALSENDDPQFDGLWYLVTIRTGSLS